MLAGYVVQQGQRVPLREGRRRQLYLASEASHIARYNPKVKMTVDAMVAASGIVSQVILFVRGSDYIP